MPLSFRPGEAFQFDWSEAYAVIGGERTKLQVAHIKLSHSRVFLVRAYLLQTHVPLVTLLRKALPVDGCCSMLTGMPSACSAVNRRVILPP